jgi:aspartate carbamoyltransferase regulatory subunit
MKELRVSAIENGTVIDHIPSKNVMKVAKILGVEGSDDLILIGTNLDSKKLGYKGVIKFANRFLRPGEVNKITLFAPDATIVTIKEF